MWRIKSHGPLAKGCIRASVEARGRGVQPTNATAIKIWQLLKQHGGSPTESLIRGVRLLMGSPWSTTATEHQHGSVSVMAKSHPEYTEEKLRLRAGIHSLNRLLPGLTPLQTDHLTYEQQLERIMRSNPDKVSGRLLFFRDLMH